MRLLPAQRAARLEEYRERYRAHPVPLYAGEGGRIFRGAAWPADGRGQRRRSQRSPQTPRLGNRRPAAVLMGTRASRPHAAETAAILMSGPAPAPRPLTARRAVYI